MIDETHKSNQLLIDLASNNLVVNMNKKNGSPFADIMKKLLLIPLVLLCSIAVTSQAKTLSKQAAHLKFILGELQVRPNDSKTQKAFLTAFPKTARDFNRLFNSSSKNELWDGNQYIFELERLVQRHATEGFQLVLGLASELKWGPDAPNYLQFVLMKVAIDNPFEFSAQYLKLSESKRKNVVKFLTESRNGPAIGYQQLIGILKRINKKTVALELEKGL